MSNREDEKLNRQKQQWGPAGLAEAMAYAKQVY